MVWARQKFIKGFLGVVFSAILPTYSVADSQTHIPPTTDEAKAIAYMKAQGVDHFLMFNKRRGQVLFVISNNITEAAPALSGKIKSDKHLDNLGSTPAGIFKMERLGQSLSIGFKQVSGTKIYYAIHPVLDIPNEQRAERISSNKPEWKRISSGCVNLEEDTISKIFGLMTIPQTFKDSQGKREATGSFFVVLPETKPVQSIFKFPMNAP